MSDSKPDTIYVTANRNGLVHVQDEKGNRLGKHHVHTNRGFLRWLRNNRPSVVVELEGMNVLPKECTCGLKVGGKC